ncbi:MAG: YidC/Oxa1 family membrane protein insertase [Clostridiales Family XIII bacterium]|nr:YidC/Oxa1 family membrane protein insertase [Clostridiales Family XIII bacterium]
MSWYYEIFGTIAKPLGVLLSFLYDHIGVYGITLIVFTLIVRGCLFPLYASQIKGQMKMQDIQPKMQALQKKYAGDRQQLGMAMQQLYKEEGYNPMMGCLPLLIQMPILMGLFVLLRNPVAYMAQDNLRMILGSHEGFWWITDLSQPDQWILPIVTGLTTFASMSMTGMGMPATPPTGDGPDMSAQMQPMMKMMRVFMPVFIVVMARTMPAGLSVYWMIGNLFTVVQTWMLKRMRTKAMNARTAAKQTE